MKLFSAFSLLAYAATTLAQTFGSYTDDNGITFWQATLSTGVGTGGGQFGMALPAAAQEKYTDEYIGRMVATRPKSGTWFGVSHTSSMTSSLLLLAWVDGESVMSSFRYASGYVEPDVYTGNASLSVIDSAVNDTHFSLTYRCENCWRWEDGGVSGSQVPATTSAAAQLIGWVQATNAPTNPSEADTGIKQHAEDGIFAVTAASARNTAYTSWVSLATATAAPASSSAPFPAGNGTATATATGTGSVASSTAAATSAACASNSTVVSQTYDYIVVGAGAGGIPLADKLSENGASVLLVERGPPSSGRWGGTLKPDWLVGTNLSRFDVPGLDNEIWVDSEGIACSDLDVMAGCVLGGGTAVNAGLWWRANPEDFDYNFPEGWKAADMQPAIDRVFERIPFTQTPSMDGIIYKPQGYEVVAGALAASGWKNVTADDVPAQKNYTFSRPNHMFSHGERGGPMATYLVSASQRSNFKLITNTTVNRVVRDGSTITGIEVEAFLDGGECGTINVTSTTGKVILSAGAFGTPKILFRSGIGPQDQLEIVQTAEGDKMINSSQWIHLPVGENLDDHVNTEIVITHPNVSFYDFYAAYDSPIPADKTKYLDHRSGILAQSAPNLAAVFWQEIPGADGITRQLQWTARVESGHGVTNNKSMVLSQYLGRGAVSRGRATISEDLNMVVSRVPYLSDANDLAAVKSGIETLQKALAADPQIQIVFPAANTSLDEFLGTYPLTTSARTANHWLGTCRMGTASGLENNGSAVVDTDTKVYGTANLFVVDASVFPGMVSTNPSALIVSLAERASERILALGARNGGGSIATAGGSGSSSTASALVPSASASALNGTSTAAAAIGTGTAAPSASGLPPGTGGEAGLYQQCDGLGSQIKTCASGLKCVRQNLYYWQCLRS
ncbi:carbohydrate-binding module family 1 Non-catalytic module family CDH [Lecanosticta acicola]|uniref:Carbohydrate-binding module family 1 Non-catalytic module family CDH n=1 Tax=Lecanosticta acicola TaxID=111012 RepID=A0AAI8Z224_9PEZI|nr:carbohydrate-binding module family 1 Non-catalytic module family CDH [Lecanosticta acicola]